MALSSAVSLPLSCMLLFCYPSPGEAILFSPSSVKISSQTSSPLWSPSSVLGIHLVLWFQDSLHHAARNTLVFSDHWPKIKE